MSEHKDVEGSLTDGEEGSMAINKGPQIGWVTNIQVPGSNVYKAIQLKA